MYFFWVILPFIIFCIHPTTQSSDIVMPKALADSTPTQQQYERILIAFRATLGHTANQHQSENGEEELSDLPLPQTLTKKPKETNVFGSLPLSLQTQTEMALELMATLDQPANSADSLALFSPETWHSLRIIDQEPSALGGIAPDMQTIFGKLFLARLLTNPTVNIETIKARQKALKELCNAPQFNEKIAHLCSKISAVQEQIIGLTSAEHPLYDKGLRIYLHDFFLRGLKPNSRGWNRFSKTFGDIWYLLGPISMNLGTIVAWRNYQKSRSSDNLERKFNDVFLLGKLKTPAITSMIALITLYNLGVQTPGIISWIKQRDRAMDYFYEQLLPLKKFFTITSLLLKRINLCPSFKPLSDEIDTVLSFNDPDIMQLRKLLMGPAFKNKINRFLFGGDLILAIDLLKKCRHKILKGIGLVGACDAYSSLTRWFNKNHNQTKTPLCFASFKVNEERPSLIVDDFWHVLTHNNPVLNSIELGNNQPQNAIITGIFESGKSTILQSIALNVVCAQSIGICLARQYTGTIASSINIYANIKDDLANNRSLFKTELYRALQLLNQIKTMPRGSFSFTIADATFTGTEAGAGQAAAYAIARHLATMPNSIALHATNFMSLSILGHQQPNHFKNFYLPTEFDGKAHQTYTLLEGTQTPQLSTTIFTEEGLPQEMIDSMHAQLAHSGI